MSKKGSSAQEPTYTERSDKRQNKYLYLEISESQALKIEISNFLSPVYD